MSESVPPHAPHAPATRHLQQAPPDRRPGLPAELSSFVGRAAELDALRALLLEDPDPAGPAGGAPRLITLCGPGGIGKTRLALRGAGLAREAYADGVWLVELAPVQDPAHVPSAALAAIGAGELPNAPPEEALARALGHRALLLVWDNCEHLLDAPSGAGPGGLAGLAALLLRRCPRLRLLATSREPLGVPGERVVRVGPLALPAPGQALAESDAGRLLAERARQTDPSFAVTEGAQGNAAVLAELCRRLDGIPLALELAAARLAVLAPAQLLSRLEDRFQALAGGPRGAPARHQTLRATLEWSHDLLSQDQRTLFARLAVFRGDFSLEAVEALGLPAALDTLAQLAAKSLVVAATAGPDGEARYSLLETVRAYALERLEERGEVDPTRALHADYFVRLASRAGPHLRGAEQDRWLRRLDADQDNLRAALEWLPARGGLTSAYRLGAEVWWYWLVRGAFREGYERLSALLSLPPPLPSGKEPAAGDAASLRARVAVGAAALLRARFIVDTDPFLVTTPDGAAGDAPLERAVAELTAAVGVFRARGERNLEAQALHVLGEVYGLGGWRLTDDEKFERLLEEAHALARDAGDRWQAAYSLNTLGVIYRRRNPERARPCFEEALALRMAIGDAWGEATSLSDLGQLAEVVQDRAAARRFHLESLAIRRRIGDARGLLNTLYRLARMAVEDQDYPAARAYLEEARPFGSRLGPTLTETGGQWLDGLIALGESRHTAARQLLLASLEASYARRWSLTPALAGLAQLAAAEGQWRRALRLAGAATGKAAIRLPPAWLRRGRSEDPPDPLLERARAALGPDDANAAWAEGAAWTTEHAIVFARHSSAEPEPSPHPAAPGAPAFPPLPAPLTGFVGREDDLDGLSRLLRESLDGARTERLVTLLGTGGIGKTRLALEVARRVRPAFGDSVCWVDLAGQPGEDAEGAALRALADATGASREPGRSLLDAACLALSGRTVLVVLDNCEHVAAWCAGAAQQLLRRCADLRVLATSREPLAIPGETLWRLQPLGLPPEGAEALPDAPETCARYDSVRLLLARARSAVPGFALTAETARHAVRLCRRLDGLPLAIELAAARLGPFGVGQLLERLERHAGLPDPARSRTPDDPTGKHHTLRATLDWSHDLLSDAERRLFARLAVFAGGWRLPDVVAVAGPLGDGDAPASAPGVADVLASLVDRSLVVAKPPHAGGEPRYRLLETVREYALERFAADPEAETVRDRHASHYAALATAAAHDLQDAAPGTPDTHQRALMLLEAEHENAIAALRRYTERGDAMRALDLGDALLRFWQTRGGVAGGRELLLAVIQLVRCHRAGAARLGSAPVVTRLPILADVLHGAFSLASPAEWAGSALLAADALVLAQILGDALRTSDALLDLARAARTRADYAWSLQLLERSLTILRSRDDPRRLGEVLDMLGYVRYLSGDAAGGRPFLEEAAVLLRRLGDDASLAETVSDLGHVSRALGDYAAARGYYEQSLALRRRASPGDVSTALRNLGSVSRDSGDLDAAERYLNEALAIYTAHQHTWPMAAAHFDLAMVALDRTDLVGARDHLRQSVRYWLGMANRLWMASPLDGFAALAAASGHHARAVTLAAAAEAHRLPTTHHPYTTSRRGLADLVLRSHEALGPGAAAEAEDAGARMTLEEAVAYALETPAAVSSRVPARTPAPRSAPPPVAVGSGRNGAAGADGGAAHGRPLSARELQVAALVAQGLTNRQIAGELIISERTAARHVEHILDKLGFASRAQVAAWIARRS